MSNRSLLGISLAIVTGLFALVLPAQAQPPPPRIMTPRPEPPRGGRKYVQFAIDPKFITKLQDHLEMEQQLGPFKDMVKQVLSNPKSFDLVPDKVKEMNIEDPKFKDAIKKWLESDPQLQKSLENWLKATEGEKRPDEVRKLQGDLKQIIDDANDDGPKNVIPMPEVVRPTPSQDDPLANFTKRAMEHAETSQIGEKLRNSPAWTRALADLRTSLKEGDSGLFPDFRNKLMAPDGKAWRVAESTLKHLRDMPRPKFDRQNVSVPGVGQIPIPDMGPPGHSDLYGPSFTSVGTAASWILAGLIVLVVLSRFVRLPTWRRKASLQDRPALGAWPVSPEMVATRDDLIRAFDYLALWSLGLDAASWNHQAVLRRWRDDAPACADSALALAGLYEQARYTDGAEELPAGEREVARKSLLQLAEAL